MPDVSLTIPVADTGQERNLWEAVKALRRAGVTFDVQSDRENQTQLWHFNDSLRGAAVEITDADADDPEQVLNMVEAQSEESPNA